MNTMHGRSSDLLPVGTAFPNDCYSVAEAVYKPYVGLTAAGLFGIFTRFPILLSPEAGFRNRCGDKGSGIILK
jgi:hypothetical protein